MKLKADFHKLKRFKINYNIFRSFLLTVSILLFFISLSLENVPAFVFAVLSFIPGGVSVLRKGVKRIKNKEYFNLDVCIVLSCVILFICGNCYQAAISGIVYFALCSVADMGRFITHNAKGVYEKNKEKLYHKVKGSETENRRADDIKAGDMIELYSGETVPCDGIVKAGTGTLNTVLVTGSNKIISVSRRDKILAGFTLLTGNVIMEVTAPLKESVEYEAVNRIKELDKEKTSNETKVRFAGNILSAVLLLVCIGFGIRNFAVSKEPSAFLYAFAGGIVVSCIDPVSGVLGLSYKSAIVRGIKNGIVLRTKKFLENTVNLKGVFFEVPGVLAGQDNTVSEVKVIPGVSEDLIVKLAAYGIYRKNDGFYRALADYGKINVISSNITSCDLYDDICTVKIKDDIEVVTGSAESFLNKGMINDAPLGDNVICVGVNSSYIGYISFNLEVKEDIRQCMESLNFAGVKNIGILTDEADDYVNEVAFKGGIDEIYSTDSVSRMQELRKSIAKASILFSPENSTLDESFNVVHYGYNRNENHGFTMNKELLVPVRLVNIINDLKIMLIQNFAIGIIGEFIILYNFINSLASGVKTAAGVPLLMFVSVIAIAAEKMNCIRYINKI